MNKKKAIKIATASAIAASGFVAAAPVQTSAAPNIKGEVAKAKDVMYNAMYAYSKPWLATGELVDRTVAYNAYKKGEAQYKYAVNYVNKYEKNAKVKAGLLADLASVRTKYLLGRSLNYIKSWNALELQVEPAAKKLDAVVASATTEEQIRDAQAELKKVYDAQQADLAAVVESSIEAHVKSEAKTAYDTSYAKAEARAEVLSVPKVSSVSAINASQLQVKFSQPVLESDVINGTAPSAAFTITPETVDGVASAIPGTLVADLSDDGKTLTLTTAATYKFEGTYTVEVTKNTVKAVKDGAFLPAFEGTVAVKDTARPTLKGLTYNAAGTVAYLEFSESITTKDGAFSITSVKRADGVALDATTVLDTTKFANSSTKRNVVEVDLAAVAVADENKNININFVGLKDEAGNLVSPNPVSITVNKDTAVKAQATISSVKRTSVTNLEVTFDKELATAPTDVTVAGVTTGVGSINVSATNPKVYNVTLTSGQQALTGIQDVTVTGFKGHNASAAVTTPVAKIVDFTVEKTAPTITSTSLTKISGVDYLVVNLDEEVALGDLAAGTFTGTVSKPNGDLDVIPTVDFTTPTLHNASLTATKSKSVKINLSTLTTSTPAPGTAFTFTPGTYSLDISAGIAKDSFGNPSAKKATAFTVSTSTAKLPAPTGVASKANTPGVVVVSFANKVDVASAQTASNYSIEGATITGARVVTNTATGATVELSIAAGTISHEGVRNVTVKNVKGYADSFAAMADYTNILAFDENVAPKLEASNAVKLTATNTIVVDFDEALVDASTGNDFDVYQNGVKVASLSALDGSDASKVVITLTTPVASTSGLVVKAASTIDLKDLKKNSVIFSDTAVSN
ncbi:hypothetical protein [Bacillus sp. CECT 9360]|uniref:hypothetical protein n=1 Tax=Bacillus sp. CECT 9360 TaxID=2845821 RepID=UPI001E4387F4|nr:hypothetical protein [Bacillus sp. CECT 9360]CAH0345147.1 hypothetical protein BCI9360_01426 [Bacillus sp. CECT 9360]